MSYSNIFNRSILMLLPFLFTGCYTQFQTLDDQFPVKDQAYSNYYDWDGNEEGQVAQTTDNQAGEEVYMDEELALGENNIYYIDYDTKRWYEENYANRLFWEGYGEGYDDGYFDGWRNSYPYTAGFSFNRYDYYRGYTGAFGYHHFYRNPGYLTFSWSNFGGYPYDAFYMGYYGQWGYYAPSYNNYWGHPYYAYNNYAYINHNRSRRYRNADIYRKGPRNSGLTNRTDGRTRDTRLKNSGKSGSRSRGSVIRTRSTNNTSRVRGTGSSSKVGRSSSGSVGRSRGSSVGKTRSGSGTTRSRGSGSSVGKRSSSSSNGKSRTRKRGSNLNDSPTSYNVSNVGSNGSTYTIPARKVHIRNRSKTTRKRNRFTLGDLIFGITNSSANYRNSTFTSGSNRSSSVRKSSHTSRTKSVGTSVKRSSSSNRSTKSRSRSSSSSSSSKKRSRGNN